MKGETDLVKLCSECGAVYTDGSWGWNEIPKHSRETACPTCHKIDIKDPDGILELRGEFFNTYRTEILNSLKVAGSLETTNNPLNRIMDIEDLNDGVRVPTTGHKTAVRLGNAIQNIYQGTLTCPEHIVKGSTVIWERD